MTDSTDLIPATEATLDPLSDVEEGITKNRAKVGSARPSSLLYTYGPGAIMDLPSFSVMPSGLDDWEPIWKRREVIPTIIEPRLLNVVRLHLGNQVDSLRPFPWQPKKGTFSAEGSDLGVPARVFPQWMRCTGCDFLGPISRFTYTNTHPFRTDLAQFGHSNCPRRGGAAKSKVPVPAVPAQHLLTCTNGHLDEFPYVLWVHHGGQCEMAQSPELKMTDANVGRSVGSTIVCGSCGARRGMAEAQGSTGREKLPQTCRGRHPHLGAFEKACDGRPALIMMGASNLWFPSTQRVIVMPRTAEEKLEELGDRLRVEIGVEKLQKYADHLDFIRDLAEQARVDLAEVDDVALGSALADALAPVDSEETRQEKLAAWDPIELLVPEWRYLQKPSAFPQQQNNSGLMVTEMKRGEHLHPRIDRIVAVNAMKRINALLGFTRLDEMDRVNDVASRLVSLTREGRPTWVPATEDRGEGIFLQLDLQAVASWEVGILGTELWEAHRRAHRRNFARRFSETAKAVNPDTRLPAPRYWLVHTLSHILIREMAMYSGYGAASLTERIYAWSSSPEREAAAGLLICTAASDSEGTLGGLVALSEPERLADIVRRALMRASRCSSDPVCAMRTPADPEDFLHGAACHTCSFASETSCERANRFLDRRFLLDLPSSAGGPTVPGFFGSVHVR